MADVCDLLCLDLPLAEELRRNRLTSQEAARADLSWIAERAQNLVSHHLRVLRDSGLAAARREGKLVLYSLTPLGRSLVETALVPHAVRA